MLSAHVQNTTIVSFCLFLFTLMGILIVFLWVILLLRFSIDEYLLFLHAYLTHIRMLSGTLISSSLHPLCGGGDLLFLPSPPAAATCFCSHLKIPTRIISKYSQYAYWPWGIRLVNFFFSFFSFFNKIQDGRQNPVAHAKARTASSICFMFGLNERPYSGRELKSCWCDSGDKNFDFFTF